MNPRIALPRANGRPRKSSIWVMMQVVQVSTCIRCRRRRPLQAPFWVGASPTHRYRSALSFLVALFSTILEHMHALAQLSIKLACRSEHFVFLPRARNSSQSAFRDRAVNQPTRSTSQQQPASGQLVWILSLYPTQHYSPIQASNKLLLLWWFSFSKGNIFLKSPFVHEKIS